MHVKLYIFEVRICNLFDPIVNHRLISTFICVMETYIYNFYRYSFAFVIDNTCFYSGSGNTVTCFCCGLEMTLEFHEDVTEKHLQLSPNCRLLRYEMQKMNDDAHRIRQQLLCKVCLANRVMITFRPCCHLATCEECADKLELCPICRTVIMEKIKTFL